MSSRALRKLQREKEAQNEIPNEESSDEEESAQPVSKPVNAFQMLNAGAGEDEDHSSDDQGEEEIEQRGTSTPSQLQSTSAKKKVKTKKKKGKKAKNKAAGEGTSKENDSDAELDEIDRALKSLGAKGDSTSKDPGEHATEEANAQLYQLLAVESKHLNALNEMKRLFGSAVLETNDEAAAAPRRRGRGPQNLDLGAALTARHSPVSKGQGLKGLALKRNPLMMGKEEWPQATGGGLGMELVEKMEDRTIEYRFVHNSVYQGVQREFESCVASMDPQRLITMLMFNPYHISTLLQVSEIAKQQGDHSVAGDLLERSLFTFGRTVQSSFTTSLTSGIARLDFRRPENREFWLASWRYVRDLGQRGTWRTAFEWAKLILSLDPEGDPYCISKIIDQLALRGGQHEHFLQLANHSFFKDDIWANMPNILISKSLCQYRLKQAAACRLTLARAVQAYPWIFARLFRELNLTNLPKSIWGKSPRTDREKFDTESYVLNAKDIWALPDSTSLLVEVVESTSPASELPPPDTRPITLDEARSTILTGSGPLINLIPRDYTTRASQSSDPLAPEDDLPSYDPSLPSSYPSNDAELEAAYADLNEEAPSPPNGSNNTDDGQSDAAAPAPPGVVTSFLARMMPWVRGAESGDEDAGSPNTHTPPTNHAAEENAEESAQLHDAFERMTELPDERPLGVDDATAHMHMIQDRQLEQLIAEQTARRRAEFERAQQEFPPEAFDDMLPDSGRPGRPPPEFLMRSMLDAYATGAGITGPGSDQGMGQNNALIDPDSDSGPEAPDSNPAPTTDPNPEEDQAHTQHWLAGTGIQSLKTYLDAHPGASAWNAPEGERLLTEYANNLARLQNRRMRDFILRYSLPQGTNADVKALVEKRMGRPRS